ncbi:MAG: hypothetical protein GX063_00130 [Firmicutes bacterium]|nr:hypothetical protein [Bacillota bacterium]
MLLRRKVELRAGAPAEAVAADKVDQQEEAYAELLAHKIKGGPPAAEGGEGC